MSQSNWESRGKTVAQLIRELQSFENQELEVRISVDGARSSVPISLVAKHGTVAVLANYEHPPSVQRHD